MPLSIALSFTSERFDYQSDLPEDYNAGNRFYGKDVAEFLAERLSESGFQSDYMDEDWGWLVFSARGTTPDFEVAVYNLTENEESNQPGTNTWGLWIREYTQKKLLGLLPKRVEVPVTAAVHAAITQAFALGGASLEPWDDGPSGED
jgi:hypothetical protein